MAAEVDICNLALARLGDSATVASIDPPEGSAQAEHCARFYPIARDTLLEMHAWKFATRRSALAQAATNPVTNWAYAYLEPANVLRLLAILPNESYGDEKPQPYETETGSDGTTLILSNQSTAVARYIVRVTDSAKFSPLFVEALSWLLASYLAGPVIKGDTGAAVAKSCYQNFFTIYVRATLSDANQRDVRPVHTPDWIGQR